MSFVQCQRGTASVEIIVMLPVFIVLFLGVMHVHSAGLAQQNATSAARACAYHYAVSGCTDDAAKSAVCEGLSVGKAGEVEAGQDSKDDISPLEEVEDWPVIGAMLQTLFGEGSNATAEREAQAFIGEDRKVSSRIYMVCNTESISWMGRLDQLMCGAAKKFGVDTMPGCK